MQDVRPGGVLAPGFGPDSAPEMTIRLCANFLSVFPMISITVLNLSF